MDLVWFSTENKEKSHPFGRLFYNSATRRPVGLCTHLWWDPGENYIKKPPFGRLSYIIRHRAIFPGLYPSIVTAAGLNCCVRDGNRCFPSAMGTDLSLCDVLACQQAKLVAPPPLLANRCVSYSSLLLSPYFSTTPLKVHCFLALHPNTKPKVGVYGCTCDEIERCFRSLVLLFTSYQLLITAPL